VSQAAQPRLDRFMSESISESISERQRCAGSSLRTCITHVGPSCGLARQYTAARPAQVRECDEYIGAGGEVADLSAAQLAHYKTLQVQYWPLHVSTSVRSVLTSVQTSALQDAAGAHAAAAQTHGRTVAACVRARPG
jgi:hypothetical protein